MKVSAIIAELTLERDKIDAAIRALQSLDKQNAAMMVPSNPTPRKPSKLITCVCGKKLHAKGMGRHQQVCPGEPKDMRKAETAILKSKVELPCRQGCGKVFTQEGWRNRHEADCGARVPIPLSEGMRRQPVI